MEFRSYTKILSDSLWFIVFATMIASLAAFLIALTRPSEHVVTLGFELSFVERPIPADYQYGGYYEQKSSEMYTQHLMSVFKNPAAIAEIYTQADVPTDFLAADEMTRRFTVKQHSNQQFIVEFRDRDLKQAEKLAYSVSSVLQEAVKRSGTINGVSQYALFEQPPFFSVANSQPVRDAILGAIVGFFASFVLVFLREYMKQ